MRVVVGMSGGVDSSVAAMLLAEQGHEIVGVSMRLWPCAPGADGEDACCSPSMARAVAARLGAPHYVVDFEAAFANAVEEASLAAWGRGETPNPCVTCNEAVKFGDLLDWAARIGAAAIGTGHYCRIVERDGLLFPAMAIDGSKDQSYFLYRLSQAQLAAARFPLGGYSKTDVRALAAARGLASADRPESQDLCFVGEAGVGGWLRQRLGPDALPAGDIVLSTDGRVLGHHRGLAHYTVGQRHGLGIGWRAPLYVIAIDRAANRLVVGERAALDAEGCQLREIVWHGDLPHAGRRVRVRCRHRSPLVAATVRVDGSGLRLDFDRPQPRPAPGQAAVCYDDDGVVLGGGTIASTALNS